MLVWIPIVFIGNYFRMSDSLKKRIISSAWMILYLPDLRHRTHIGLNYMHCKIDSFSYTQCTWLHIQHYFCGEDGRHAPGWIILFIEQYFMWTMICEALCAMFSRKAPTKSLKWLFLKAHFTIEINLKKRIQQGLFVFLHLFSMLWNASVCLHSI